MPLQLGDDRTDGKVDAPLQVHGIGAGGNRAGAFPHDGLGENGRGRGAVAGHVVGLRGHLAHHLRAHVLELVLELDLLGDSDAVLGRAWRAEGLLDHDIAPFGPERDFDGIGKDVDALQHSFAGLVGEFHFLGRHDWSSDRVRPRASDKPVGSNCHAAKRHGSASIAQLE